RRKCANKGGLPFVTRYCPYHPPSPAYDKQYQYTPNFEISRKLKMPRPRACIPLPQQGNSGPNVIVHKSIHPLYQYVFTSTLCPTHTRGVGMVVPWQSHQALIPCVLVL
ncbi:unnamed protein product, partial [Ectocarpus sp. 12 AP-2014]